MDQPDNPIKFRSLKIETVQYGPDKGKLTAEITLTGNKSTTTMFLPDDVATRILALAKEAIIDGVEKAANDFIFEITATIPDSLLLK